jgi:hypothetical protein
MKVLASRHGSGSRRSNEKAGIEGLPLMLLIMIVVAAVALGILLIWLNSSDRGNQIGTVVAMSESWPGRLVKSIAITPLDYHNCEGFYALGTSEFKMVVYDDQDNLISGAEVTWSGCGFSGSTMTENDGGGDAPCPQCNVVLPIGQQEGKVQVQVTKHGYGSANAFIPVIRGETGGPIFAEP